MTWPPGQVLQGQTPPDIRRRLALGLGISAAPILAAGVGLTLAGRLQYVNVLHGDACEGNYRVGCGDAVLGPSPPRLAPASACSAPPPASSSPA